MSAPISVAIAYHSGYGHTARQAAAVAAGADSVPTARAVLLDVTTLDGALWATLDAAEAIIFGSPTYMGGTSATFQAFAEASSAIWADGGWRDKLAAGFTNSAGLNGDKLNTLTSMALFAAQHGMNWVTLALPPVGCQNSGRGADQRQIPRHRAHALRPSHDGPRKQNLAAESVMVNWIRIQIPSTGPTVTDSGPPRRGAEAPRG